jgi:four helix bundle protein
MSSQFDHERLTVYHVALDFLVVVEEVVNAFPLGRAYLGDQLHRASTSIVLNIAEGAGEFSKKDKARFYRMALRSATECAAVVDVCKRLQLAKELDLLAGRRMLLRIVSMLVPLVRSMGGSGMRKAQVRQSGMGTGTGTGTGKDSTGGGS